MDAKDARNVGVDAWSSNPAVTMSCDDFSDLAAGYYSRRLKMPLTPDRLGCYERHGVFAPRKYDDTFTSPAFLAALDSAELTELSGGTDFRGTANHWHYMVDGLGTLSSAVLRPGCVLFVDAELSDDQIGFLRRHAGRHVAGGLEQIERVGDEVVRISNFRFCANKSIRFKVPAARKTLGVVSRPPTAGDSKLFVLRRHARTRVLLNQDALAEMLQRRFGFTPVDPGALSLERQKALFSTARVIIGPHGAALTNAICSECPQLVIEIYHSKQQPFFKLMCEGLGARHVYVEGAPGAGQINSSRYDDADYTVDVQSVVGVVQQYAEQFEF